MPIIHCNYIKIITKNPPAISQPTEADRFFVLNFRFGNLTAPELLFAV